jgi:hypothetical protein
MSEEIGLDSIIRASLQDFAVDTFGKRWLGKENDWVNFYAHGFLARRCVAGSPLLYDHAQISIEVGVPQAGLGYARGAVRRDLVIWPQPGMSCWDESWNPTHHPQAVMEWKVHRPGHRNRAVAHEREWLRRYTRSQPQVLAYAVEVDLSRGDPLLRCHRFLGGQENPEWFRFPQISRTG